MTRFPLAIVAALAAGPALAQDHREMGAHVHGVTTAEIAVEGSRVEIDLRAPGMDIAGFEYAAESAADRDALQAAILQLARATDVVTFPEAAGCRLTEVVAHVHGDDNDGHDDDHGGHDDDHDDHADHGEHDDHGDHDHRAGHSEFHVTYGFDCAAPEALTQIKFPFFDRFPNAQEIEAQYVTDTTAGAVEIGRNSGTLTLK
ncbi:zinc uptake protein ZrgA [Chachezhania sediminis]|uniref:zinc uptake protein ZrgA n=1 Tax=Chachezhania sediminis TaxID=2599291 RepID=UPI00131A75A4|nr:DUF2796 domain-containing protein [Chachezhania sediminis]